MRASRTLYESLRSQIVRGERAAGTQLPSTRGLAEELGVSRTTITAVYEQLAAEGYLETSAGTRARVAPGVAARAERGNRPAREAASPTRAAPLSAFGNRVAAFTGHSARRDHAKRSIDFLYGAVAFDDFPTLAWRRAYNRVIVQRQPRLYYEEPEGELALREALQGYLLRARGMRCRAEQILVVHGSQQALDLCARVLLDAGDDVVIEEPCYIMARRIFEAVGARIHGCPVDEQGLNTPALAGLQGRLVYVTPSHQFPLGGVMPIGRRRELLDWAGRAGAWVIEDDYDGEFRYGQRPVDALQSVDGAGRVIYVGTFSKTLSPQMRLGYMVLPPALVHVFREAKRLIDRHAPSVEQRALAALIEDGSYERHVRRCRRENGQRRQALLEALQRHVGDGVEVQGSASGLHVVAWFAQVARADEPALVEQAKARGVGVRPISPLYADTAHPGRRPCAGLILGYASLDAASIETGVRQLAQAVRWLARPARPA
ncbi:GntR family transcriptional regulator [Bordetella ansorpii]|uniref:GntR family transcriptional regulator n=1 Tax=Bordetella ansorpii TaxID=288768 RepID=A0A157SWC0_9BORD|nr:PLP-dependent aminotransferase family protein [Bordetella ansorpii]SAI74737.1 GntR family transcriptional regulator [Bordetella ansorpii]